MFSDKFKKDLDPIHADPNLINRTRAAISKETGAKERSPLAKRIHAAHRRYAGLALAAALGPALRAARIEPSEVIREV